jgi:hypothetical protein
MKHFIRPRTLGLVVMAATLPWLLGASASSPDLATCPSNPDPLAVFDVADRAALAQRIPGLANAPEVAGDPILINGRPGGLEGALHVTVYACLPWGAIPIFPPLIQDTASLLTVVRNIVVVQTASLDAWWLADVPLDGFVP